MEACNNKMKEMANTQIYGHTGHKDIKKAQLDNIIRDTREDASKIQKHLALMKNDINDSESKYPSEPETRVKKTVHRTFSHKFQSLVRSS